MSDAVSAVCGSSLWGDSMRRGDLARTSRGARARAAAVAVVCGLVLAACGSSHDDADPAPDDSPSPSAPVTLPPTPSAAPTTVVPAPTTTPPPATADPLSDKSFKKGSCVADDRSATTPEDGTAGLTQVPCADPTAVEKVVEREPFDVTKVTSCGKGAENADTLAQLTRSGTGKDGGKLQYAPVCLRNLTAPHPGDAGHGGGPNIIKGDCLVEKKSYQLDLTGSGSGTSTYETACDGAGADAPDYRVIAMGTTTIVKGEKGIPCPPSTQAQFTAPSEIFIGAVYCAKRV